MRRVLIGMAATTALLGAAGALAWFGTLGGWWGGSPGAGTIEGKAIPADIVADRATRIREMAPAGDEKLILFGDLHVHTTISADAFLSSLPLLSGTGVHPLADACDFARYCSAVDFWASTDHAESITPPRWQIVKDAVRACQKVSGNDAAPDLVSFIGYEWTQVGRTPAEHFGHKNVIFRDLEDEKVSARPIAAITRDGDTAMRRRARSITPRLQKSGSTTSGWRGILCNFSYKNIWLRRLRQTLPVWQIRTQATKHGRAAFPRPSMTS